MDFDSLAMAEKLSDRLNKASSQLFVGRKEQLALFRKMLAGEIKDVSILSIFGPGGIGKTSLLFEYQRICKEHKTTYTYLDARSIAPEPGAFLEALSDYLGITTGESPVELLGYEGKHVLMLDTFEWFSPLEQWLFSDFFANLNASVLIVLSGRYPLQSLRDNHPGWASIIKKESLRNLSSKDSTVYLKRTGIPEEQIPDILSFTHGHPLALSLIAERYSIKPDAIDKWEADPDFIKTLIERFLNEAPDPAHRYALEASAVVKFLTEPLLAKLLEQAQVHELFQWLRNLSFMEAGPRGVFPHDLARDALGSDLRWRNPEQYNTIHSRARAYYNAQLQQASLKEQANILTDYIFLHRENAIVKPFFEQLRRQWKGAKSITSIDQYTDTDRPALLEMVEQNEGEIASRYLAFWLDRQPERVLLYREHSGECKGFLLSLSLDLISKEDLDFDPVVKNCWHYLEKESPLRGGETATLFRFWMDREKHHSISRTQSQIFVQMVRHYIVTPGLAFSFLPIAYPDFFGMIFTYADLHRIKSLDFTENGLHFGIFTHDWRQRPPGAWLNLLGSREVNAKPAKSEPPDSATSVLVLSEDDFKKAIKEALRSYSKPQKLKSNPLLQSRIVVDHLVDDYSIEKRIEKLKQLVDDCLEKLKGDPKALKGFRAIEKTYIRPAQSQEIAAELLQLPYSTFRRHLNSGVEELSEILWEMEIGQQ